MIDSLTCAGNTCFVNAAIQCLRYTPGFLEHLSPERLARFMPEPEEEPSPASTPASVSPHSSPTQQGDEAAAEAAAGKQVSSLKFDRQLHQYPACR